ncbi:MAG TPA: hypothetical protein VGZ22_18025 [Isosphaeraceae bacterium]|jgi:hypothetical protein|nr:hypothetical protein [Isosphaeraceae bacterium]
MEGAVMIRKVSTRWLAVTFAALLALGAGGSSYWLLNSASSHPSQVKVIPPRPATATRHAAAERAEADQNTASDLAAAMIRHAQQERAEAGPSQ